MPGRGSYGPGGKFIHDRAHRIMREGETQKQYGEKKGKQIAYAVATQQAHKLGKSPKGFRTPGGVATAKKKFDQPVKEYKKTAAEQIEQMAKTAFLFRPSQAGFRREGLREFNRFSDHAKDILRQYPEGLSSKEYDEKVVNTWNKLTGSNMPSYEQSGGAGEDPSWFIEQAYKRKFPQQASGQAPQAKEGEMDKHSSALFVPPMVTNMALDILEKQAKLDLKTMGKGIKRVVKKVVGTAPGGANPLNPGSGIKGAIGRIATPM